MVIGNDVLLALQSPRCHLPGSARLGINIETNSCCVHHSMSCIRESHRSRVAGTTYDGLISIAPQAPITATTYLDPIAMCAQDKNAKIHKQYIGFGLYHLPIRIQNERNIPHLTIRQPLLPRYAKLLKPLAGRLNIRYRDGNVSYNDLLAEFNVLANEIATHSPKPLPGSSFPLT